MKQTNARNHDFSRLGSRRRSGPSALPSGDLDCPRPPSSAAVSTLGLGIAFAFLMLVGAAGVTAGQTGVDETSVELSTPARQSPQGAAAANGPAVGRPSSPNDSGAPPAAPAFPPPQSAPDPSSPLDAPATADDPLDGLAEPPSAEPFLDPTAPSPGSDDLPFPGESPTLPSGPDGFAPTEGLDAQRVAEQAAQATDELLDLQAGVGAFSNGFGGGFDASRPDVEALIRELSRHIEDQGRHSRAIGSRGLAARSSDGAPGLLEDDEAWRLEPPAVDVRERLSPPPQSHRPPPPPGSHE